MRIPLDTITKLQDMEVLDKKPPFPKIVVLGEACAGTSVIGTLISKFVEPIPEDKRSSIEITLTIIQPQVSDLMVTLLPEIHTHHYIGTRTITVFTKVNLSDEYLITQLTSKNIETPSPFGYFFVDNTNKVEVEVLNDDDEKTEEWVLLSKVDKDCIGFDVISKNRVTALLSILFNHSSLILKRIESDIKESDLEIKQCQKTFDSVSDAIPVILSVVNSAKRSIHKLFISEEYEEHEKDEYMHAASNMALQFRRFKTDLHDLKLDNRMPFLQFEIELLSSRNWPTPLNFVSSSIIKPLLNRQFSCASSTIDKFVSSIMNYIGVVVGKVLQHEK
ncbi:dynamin-related protein 4C-like [Bidens hawaiensis]|uniref:dynamin-related protein 4C-like n=1 Tax=Bidens hawaiensis TaxID=980011 RepID=UPI004049C721